MPPDAVGALPPGSRSVLNNRLADGMWKCVGSWSLLCAEKPELPGLWLCRGPAPRLDKCLAACSRGRSCVHLRTCAAPASRLDAPLLSMQYCLMPYRRSHRGDASQGCVEWTDDHALGMQSFNKDFNATLPVSQSFNKDFNALLSGKWKSVGAGLQ